MGQLINNPLLPNGWLEYIGKNVPGPAGGSLEWGAGNRIMRVYDGPFLDLHTFMQFLLGYSQRGDGGALNRYMPHRLPWLPHLICTQITNLQPYKFVRKAQTASFGPYAEYERVRVTTAYTCPSYAVVDDTDLARLHAVNNVPDESKRFVVDNYEPTVEAIQRPVGSFKYSETSATGPAIGTEVASGVTQVLTKAQLTLTWMLLPEYGARNLNGVPAIQEAMLGKVNNATWRGHAAGTLLFKAIRMEPVPSPFPLPFIDVQRQWNMSLIFSKFDPPNGGATRGWNLVPYPGDNLWYAVQDSGGNGRTLYQTGDFSTLFTLNG